MGPGRVGPPRLATTTWNGRWWRNGCRVGSAHPACDRDLDRAVVAQWVPGRPSRERPGAGRPKPLSGRTWAPIVGARSWAPTFAILRTLHGRSSPSTRARFFRTIANNPACLNAGSLLGNNSREPCPGRPRCTPCSEVRESGGIVLESRARVDPHVAHAVKSANRNGIRAVFRPRSTVHRNGTGPRRRRALLHALAARSAQRGHLASAEAP